MKYIDQVITVTQWELKRFFKPKNEAIGLLIMLVISSVSYLVTRLALKDPDTRSPITLVQDIHPGLAEKLSSDFTLVSIPADQKESFVNTISETREGILLLQNESSFTIHAYKNNRTLKKLRSVLDEYHREVEIQKAGITQATLETILSPASINESFVYTSNSTHRVILATGFAILMIMAVFLSFAYQFTSITGEKQLKITEQIISAIRPQVWMDGKIFGITLTGIFSMLTYSILGILGGILFFQFTGKPISSIQDYLHLPSILLFLPFALTGILIWNAVLAAVASAITDPNNSGKSSLMMLPVLFVVSSFLVLREPDNGLAVFLSWFPFTSASAMPMRWAVTEVDAWQLAGSFVLLGVTFYVLRKLAGKIFHVSILMSGKEPTWKEIFKLLKDEK